MTFYILDVFAEARYQGNPLCVFVDAAGLTDEQMGQRAREINFPETTFITGGTLEAGFTVRIFTPESEVPFAGHPTLGTAYVLANYLLNSNQQPITLNLKAGPIVVEQQTDTYWLAAAQPHFGRTFNPGHLAELLHLPEDALDEDYPSEWVSTGLPFIIIPLRSRDALRQVRLDADACRDWLLRHNLYKTNSVDQLTSGFYMFCNEPYNSENHLNARMFCLENGAIIEDPATGSAASCLLAYLLKNQRFGLNTLRLRLEQGYELNRPSLIELDGKILATGAYSLRIGGRVQYVAKGEWLI